jgi:hypothetical protein
LVLRCKPPVGLLAATLGTLAVVAGLPERPVVHLDAGYDYQTCRLVLACRGMTGQIALPAGCPPRSRSAVGG